MTAINMPSGWRRTTLGDLASYIRNGIFLSRPTADASGTPILRISAVKNGFLDMDDVKYVGGVDSNTAERFSVKEGDLLFTRYNGSRNLVGRCAEVPPHSVRVLHPDKLIRVVIPTDGVDVKFIAHQMESARVRTFLEPRIKTTAGQSGIAGSDIRSIPVLLPGLDEQRRIVDILEDHLSHLSTADHYLEAVESRIDAALTSLIASDQALQSAQKRPLTELLAQPLANGRSVPTRVGGFPVLRLTSLTRNGIDLSQRKGGAWNESDAKRFLISQGDFLVSRGNGSLRLLARGALVNQVPDPVAYPDTLIRIRLNATLVDPQYFSAIWNSVMVRRQIERLARTTAGIYKVNQRDLGSILLPVPAMNDQLRVATFTRQLTEAGDRLVTATQSAKSHSKILKSALLSAAFSGRFTDQYRNSEELVSV